MVESTPKVSSRPRSRTRATMGSCGASTGFSCQMEGRRCVCFFCVIIMSMQAFCSFQVVSYTADHERQRCKHQINFVIHVSLLYLRRFFMREKHVLKFLNQTTTSARKVKCVCSNIQSTPNSHMAATDLRSAIQKLSPKNIFQICFHSHSIFNFHEFASLSNFLQLA